MEMIYPSVIIEKNSYDISTKTYSLLLIQVAGYKFFKITIYHRKLRSIYNLLGSIEHINLSISHVELNLLRLKPHELIQTQAVQFQP